MKVRIALWIEKITSLFWIIPGVIVISSIILAYYLQQIEFQPKDPLLRELFFFKAEPEAVRSLLSAIATSVMTVLGVVFSIIVVVIEQMSNQYTPRVISNFARSKMAQLVLGLFAGTFSFCLVLLMNVDGSGEDLSISGVAVAVASLFALLCLFFLILYIHSVTNSIQSTQIIKDISDEAIEALKNVINDREDAHQESPIRSKAFPFCKTLHASTSGYIDSIYWENISDKIKKDNWEIHFHKAAGDFVQKGMELLTFWSDEPIEDKTLQKIESLFDIAPSRTISQDPGYGIQKLSDIALKGLSPGINDPSTAMEAIHSITTILLEYVENSPIRNRVHLDDNKVLIFLPTDPQALLRKGYDYILRFTDKHEPIKELIRQDLRFIQSKISEKEFKKHIEMKIETISLLQ